MSTTAELPYVVYVVMAGYKYDGTTAVKAFRDVDRAAAVAAAWSEYATKRPVYPADQMLDLSYEEELLSPIWLAYHAAEVEWESHKPWQGEFYVDYFCVAPLELDLE